MTELIVTSNETNLKSPSEQRYLVDDLELQHSIRTWKWDKVRATFAVGIGGSTFIYTRRNKHHLAPLDKLYLSSYVTHRGVCQPNVFCLYYPKGRSYLFRASSKESKDSWTRTLKANGVKRYSSSVSKL